MSIELIVVATDFSARADRAIDRAKLISADTGAKLRFIHATNLAEDDPPEHHVLDSRMRNATGLKSGEGGVEFDFLAGSPPKAIANAAERGDVSLLVIGPARYNSLGDFFMGTAVDYVLRHTSKPVIVAKTRAHRPYRQIVAGTDFSPGSAHAILSAARMFPQAAIHVIHGWNVPFQAWQTDQYVAEEVERDSREKLKTFMAGLTERESRLSDATSELVRGSAIDSIRSGVEFDPSALVVLGSHGASGFRQAAIGSVTSELLRLIEADTLVVNTRNA